MERMMSNESGVIIAVSPVQMAAVMSDKTVSEGETLSNRIYGGLGLLGGVAEMFGAGAMCVAPEPTMLTKAGCVVVGTHSLDTIQASLRQVWTGKRVASDTYNSAVELAEKMGADRNTAMHVGMTVDLAVPISFALAIGGVRIAAIRAGRISLAEHEALSLKGPGGHTIERHIGQSPEELLARLVRRPGLDQTSSFRTVAEAEKLISAVLRDNRRQIEMWVKHVPSNLPARMTLSRTFSRSTGIAVQRGSSEIKPCYHVRVTLEFRPYHGKPYFVLTAFPEP